MKNEDAGPIYAADIVDCGTYRAIRLYEEVDAEEYERNEDKYDCGDELVYVEAGTATLRERVSGYDWEMPLEDVHRLVLAAGYSEEEYQAALSRVSGFDE